MIADRLTPLAAAGGRGLQWPPQLKLPVGWTTSDVS